jgi:peptidoglycan/xylan/chitin deacetylase (PgdA/CDA1 family)
MWPESKRCAVGLSFDFDAETMWFRTMKQPFPGQMSRGEYGARAGVPRILELLRRYEIRATFFVPGWTADTYPGLIEQMHAAGHELAHHGYEHEYVVNKGREIELEVLEKGIDSLRRITGEVPKGYRSPAGNTGPHTFDLLLDHGFVYDSSLVGHDEPYWLAAPESDRHLLEVPFSWEMTDTPHFLFSYVPYYAGMSSHHKVYEIWEAEFDAAYAAGGYLCVVMHPQIIGRRSRMAMLEKLLQRMVQNGGVWFATHLEVAQTWVATHPVTDKASG